ncbi:MAG: flagellar basal-body rod protein FlgF [bacterium]|nr:flagellar basal-body rod protein FlgF [bacterium]
MLRGIYTGCMGMLAQWWDQNVTSNNLANVNSTGYKKDVTVFKSIPHFQVHRINDEIVETPFGEVDKKPCIGNLGTGVVVDDVVTIFTQGPVKETGNKLDLALVGSGFFTIQMMDKEEMYTRNGTFTLNRDGFLVTMQGNYVLGEKGPIQIKGEPVVRGDGVVLERLEKGYRLIDKLKLVDFQQKIGLIKRGDSLYSPTSLSGLAEPAKDIEVRQGFLEASNVNVIHEMVNMIQVSRIYEANQRTIRSMDDTLRRAVTDVGRVGG